MIGVVEFLIGDNIYVRFAQLRWRSQRVFFAEQLRFVCRPPEPSRETLDVHADSAGEQ